MAKINFILLTLILGLGVTAATLHAGEATLGRLGDIRLAGDFAADVSGDVAMAASQEAEGTLGRPHGGNEMIGAVVKNHQGVELGTIRDFVIDSQGRVAFAVISHGGFLWFGRSEVAVPFASLSYDRKGDHFLLDLSKERFETAPKFSMRDLFNEKWADDVYRFFGQQPYWTEGELVEKGMKYEEPQPMPLTEYPHQTWP